MKVWQSLLCGGVLGMAILFVGIENSLPMSTALFLTWSVFILGGIVGAIAEKNEKRQAEHRAELEKLQRELDQPVLIPVLVKGLCGKE